jgi:hypothetical protein
MRKSDWRDAICTPLTVIPAGKQLNMIIH